MFIFCHRLLLFTQQVKVHRWGELERARYEVKPKLLRLLSGVKGHRTEKSRALRVLGKNTQDSECSAFFCRLHEACRCQHWNIKAFLLVRTQRAWKFLSYLQVRLDKFWVFFFCFFHFYLFIYLFGAELILLLTQFLNPN